MQLKLNFRWLLQNAKGLFMAMAALIQLTCSNLESLSFYIPLAASNVCGAGDLEAIRRLASHTDRVGRYNKMIGWLIELQGELASGEPTSQNRANALISRAVGTIAELVTLKKHDKPGSKVTKKIRRQVLLDLIEEFEQEVDKAQRDFDNFDEQVKQQAGPPDNDEAQQQAKE